MVSQTVVPIAAEQPSKSDAASVWLERTAETLRRLSRRPGVLFTVLWAASALSAPYANFFHDAKLYGVLVLNRISGSAFADDLFLRFGSQDQYSSFSMLAAPLARLIGVEWTFFLLFFVFNALLIYAMQRVVTALIDDGILSTLALLFMVMAPLPYGGLRVFLVHEAFFTPRVIACAVALLGLEQSLRQHHVRALGFAVVATIVHPLMGCGVLMISGGCAVLEVVPRRLVWWIFGVAAAAGLMVLALPSLGVRVFGTMDPEWLEIVRSASAYNFPGEWMMSDWFKVSLALGVLVSAGLYLRGESPCRARFLFMTVATGVVCLVVTLMASRVPYRLLLQGQPYRALWIVVAIHVPLALWLAARAWREGVRGQVLAVMLIGCVGVPDFPPVEPAILLIALPLLILVQRGTRAMPRYRDWLVRSLAGTLVVGVLASGTINVSVAVAMARDVLELVDPMDYGRVFLSAFGPLFWLGIVLAGLTAALRRHGPSRLVLLGGILSVVLAHAAAFLVPRIPGYRESEHPYGRDIAYVRTYLAQRPPAENARPTVYAGAWGNVEYLWFDLGVKSYYDLSQVVGVIFSRQTAIEAAWRGAIVRPFELDRYQGIERFAAPALKVMVSKLFRPELDTRSATRDDLAHLCRSEEGVDMAILRQDFVGLSSASNERIYIYECARVRATAGNTAGLAEQRNR
jgi:hypothetical protein